MKFYTLVIKTYNDGTADKTSLYSYDSIDEAMATAHTQYGQNVGEDTIASIMTTVIDSNGGQYSKHTLYWAESTDDTEDDTTE